MQNSAINLSHSAPAKGAVILLHGLTATPKEVEPLGRALFEQGFDVSMPLLSGHGNSIEELRRARAAQWRKDAADAVSRCKTRPLVIGGVSLGALLAFDAAAHYPQAVSGIIALSPPMRLRSEKTERKLAVFSVMPNRIIDRLKTTPKTKRDPQTLAFPRDCFEEHSIGSLVRLVQIRRAVLPKLKRIPVPVLLLQDPNDHHLSPASQQLLKNRLTNAPVESHEIPDGSHELILGHRHPEVCQLVLGFLERIMN
jgi:carboxylesterase